MIKDKVLLSCPLVLKYRLLKLRRLTKDVAFGILSMFLPPGGNGSVCSASKAIEDAGRRIFYMEIINMAWVMLGIAGIFEVVWATCMKYSEGFTKLSWSLLTFAGMAVSFLLLARATKTLPLGTAYAVWTGIGALGSVIVGILLFKEPVTAGRLIFAALLLIGIIGLKITSA